MRRTRTLAAATAAALLAGALPAAAGTAPEPQAAEHPAHAPEATVTLVTGDRVTTSIGADGLPTVAFEAAPRADGRPVTFEAFGGADDTFYVVPSDVAALVPDKLDLRLFEVGALDAAQEEDETTVPVIVQATTPPGGKAAEPRWDDLHVEPERTLESIDSVAGEVDAARPATLVDAVEQGEDVTKVWLDAPLETNDAIPLSHIGADSAGAAGLDGTGTTVAVLDTGIDTTHPDLDGGIVTMAKDFTGEGRTDDPIGHGTHVASIIAGTGEASDGEYAGAARGAHLLNGRVLGGNGKGEESWAIEAMEWAAENGADVINMSLGVKGLYTDGKDPSSLAVDAISAKYDALVVIAAGNDGGQGAFTVTTPGTADSALTVAAVDDSGFVTGFSSRGPRAGDFALKPDISAPGNYIGAARATGTSDGDPLSDLYTQMSGTSMAAPHVAAAAAIVKQARPDLDGEALKSILMNSAMPTGNPVFSEGAGRVWIPGAFARTVYSTPASVSFGLFDSPRAGQTSRTQTVTYTNTTDQDVEAHLALALQGDDSQPVELGFAALSTDTLTIPARGTASVDVTIDPQADVPSVYAGTLHAYLAGGPPVRTVVAFQVFPDLHTLTVEMVDRSGKPATMAGGWVHGIDDPSFNKAFEVVDGVARVRLPLGRYAIAGEVFDAQSPTSQFLSSATQVTADVDMVPGDAVVRFDTREATPVQVATERDTTLQAFDQELERHLPGRYTPVISTITMGVSDYAGGVDLDLYVLGAGDPVVGGVTVTTRRWFAEPLLQAATTGKKAVDVSAELGYAVRSPRLTGRVAAPLVDGGKGTPAELAAVAAEGAIVLVEDVRAPVDPETGQETGGWDAHDQTMNARAQAARDAGALALVVYGSTPGPFHHEMDNRDINQMKDQALPSLTLDRKTGLELVAAAAHGATLKGTGRQTPSYQYVLGYVAHEDSAPAELDYAATAKNTAAVPTELRAFPGDDQGARLYEMTTIHSGQSLSGRTFYYDGPVTDRTVYYSTEPGVTFSRSTSVAEGAGATPAKFWTTPVSFQPGKQAEETFGAQVHHGGLWPSPATTWDSSAYRDGDYLIMNLPLRVDGEGNAQAPGEDDDTTSRFQAWQGDTLLTDVAGFAGLWSTVTPDGGRFRARLETHRETPWWPLSTHVVTEWGFESGTTGEPTVLPLLQLDYGVQGLDEHNTGGRRTTLDLQVSHQDGAPAGAEITGLDLWSSVDDGATWTPVKVSSRGDGAYRAVVTAPDGASSVSLRVSARDGAGGTFDETVTDAFAVDTARR